MKEPSSFPFAATAFNETQMQRQLTELRLPAFLEHYQSLASTASQNNAAYEHTIWLHSPRQKQTGA